MSLNIYSTFFALFWFITYYITRMSVKNPITLEVLERILDNKLKPMLSSMDELRELFNFSVINLI
jgi:hypothetical protein